MFFTTRPLPKQNGANIYFFPSPCFMENFSLVWIKKPAGGVRKNSSVKKHYRLTNRERGLLFFMAVKTSLCLFGNNPIAVLWVMVDFQPAQEIDATIPQTVGVSPPFVVLWHVNRTRMIPVIHLLCHLVGL